MPDNFLYFRCWPGFSDSFQFERFNGLSDDDLDRNLTEFARIWLRDNKKRVREFCSQRRKEVLAAVETRQRQFTRQPMRRINQTTNEHRTKADAIRGYPGSAPLFEKIAFIAGWLEKMPTIFQRSWNESSGSQLRARRKKINVGPLTWFHCTSNHVFAAQLVNDLSEQRSLDYGRNDLIFQLNPRYGYIPGDSVSQSKAASIRRAIQELASGNPTKPYAHFAIAVQRNAQLVAQQLAHNWVETSTEPANGARVAAAGETPALQSIAKFAADKLRGKQRRVVELIVEGGGVALLADIASDPDITWEVPFDDLFNSVRKALNKRHKLPKIGWKLIRQDGEARIIPAPRQTPKGQK